MSKRPFWIKEMDQERIDNLWLQKEMIVIICWTFNLYKRQDHWLNWRWFYPIIIIIPSGKIHLESRCHMGKGWTFETCITSTSSSSWFPWSAWGESWGWCQEENRRPSSDIIVCSGIPVRHRQESTAGTKEEQERGKRRIMTIDSRLDICILILLFVT